VAQDEARVRILLPGRKNPQWVSKTHLLPVPASLRLLKKAEFDQKCGCTSFVDVNGQKVETYNVYGSVGKYLKSGISEGLDASAHHRRVFLSEKGFVRAKGAVRNAKDLGAVLFNYQKDGYKILSGEKKAKAPKIVPVIVEAPVAAPVPEAVPAV
jgi:hypothetical protein